MKGKQRIRATRSILLVSASVLVLSIETAPVNFDQETLLLKLQSAAAEPGGSRDDLQRQRALAALGLDELAPYEAPRLSTLMQVAKNSGGGSGGSGDCCPGEKMYSPNRGCPTAQPAEGNG